MYGFLFFPIFPFKNLVLPFTPLTYTLGRSKRAIFFVFPVTRNLNHFSLSKSLFPLLQNTRFYTLSILFRRMEIVMLLCMEFLWSEESLYSVPDLRLCLQGSGTKTRLTLSKTEPESFLYTFKPRQHLATIIDLHLQEISGVLPLTVSGDVYGDACRAKNVA